MRSSAMRESDCQSDRSQAHSRRNFLMVTASTAVVPALGRAANAQADARDANPSLSSDPVSFLLEINERQHRVALDVRTTLLDTLREHLGLTGSKKGLRPGTVRRLYGAGRWPPRALVLDAYGERPGTFDHNDRRNFRSGRRAPSHAAGLYRA